MLHAQQTPHTRRSSLLLPLSLLSALALFRVARSLTFLSILAARGLWKLFVKIRYNSPHFLLVGVFELGLVYCQVQLWAIFFRGRRCWAISALYDLATLSLSLRGTGTAPPLTSGPLHPPPDKEGIAV